MYPDTDNCPCGSDKNYAECCKPVHEGASPELAVNLMRARYSAYAADQISFLGSSLHPNHADDYDEKATRGWAESSTWISLTICGTEAGGADDNEGTVDFIARYRANDDGVREHRELASFARHEGKWCYTDGKPVVEKRTNPHRNIGRNDPCFCGSGKKFKKCCGK